MSHRSLTHLPTWPCESETFRRHYMYEMCFIPFMLTPVLTL